MTFPRYTGTDPAGEAKTELDHFGNCPVGGALVDMRDLGQVMAHAHGQEAQELDAPRYSIGKPLQATVADNLHLGCRVALVPREMFPRQGRRIRSVISVWKLETTFRPWMRQPGISPAFGLCLGLVTADAEPPGGRLRCVSSARRDAASRRSQPRYASAPSRHLLTGPKSVYGLCWVRTP